MNKSKPTDSFRLAVPIHWKDSTNRQEVLKVLQSVRADYVILAFDDVILSAERESYERTFSSIKDVVPFLQEHGYTVGIWFWSLWLADIDEETLSDAVMVNSSGNLRVATTALNSNENRLSGFLCPTSSKIQIMLDIVNYVARLAPDFILLNDDLDYATHMGSIGCYCERHLTQMEKKCGRKFTREQLREAVACGKPNEIRNAWLELSGQTLENYAEKVRETIDSVNPAIRCGLSCVMSNWGIDGTTAYKLARKLAGDTKPLIRLIGAPYWAVHQLWDNRLQHTVELARMESSWISDKDVELIAEGDVYPRPRHRVAASFLENYDTAIRAAGCCNGIFKLMFDYAASFGYETGYLSRHIGNLKLASEIERVFGGKTPIGVRVYESMRKIENADFSDIRNPEAYAANLFFSYAARVLSDNTVPTKYEGTDGVGIAFGESARHLPPQALDNGLILDVRAARILSEMGIDVGLKSVVRLKNNNWLQFPSENERIVSNYRDRAAYEIEPKAGAQVVTWSMDGEKLFADAFHYENSSGQRFLVYAFDAAFTDENRYRNYCTQRQLISSIEWLSRKKLPAVCLGNPDLYVICKEDETGTAIGLWNLFADDVPAPEIKLSKSYRSAEFIGCKGTLDGNALHLTRIEPYGHAFINLKN